MNQYVAPELLASSPSSTRQKEIMNSLISQISPMIEPLGYLIVHLEIQSHPSARTLRIYIDHHPPYQRSISITDCATVSQALQESLDQVSEIKKLFPGTYDLEISSPGLNRPLRTATDFQFFQGRSVILDLERPLTQEEMKNPAYFEKNPRQKHFKGSLDGFYDQQVILKISSFKKTDQKNRSCRKKKHQPTQLKKNSEEGWILHIPLPLISKANLDPDEEYENAMKER